MNYKELTVKYNNFFDLISKKQVKDAFDILKELIDKCMNKDLKNQLDNNYNIYQNILKYSFELGDDPEKESVYDRLLKSITELTDDAKEDIICNYKLLSYYQHKAEIKHAAHLNGNESDEMVKHLEFEREIIQMLNSTPGVKKSSSIEEEEKYKKSLINIFKIIWLTDKLKEGEIELVNNICKTKALPWYDKCLVVSSLTLSLLRHFDSEKIALLFNFYETDEDQVCQRALLGLTICLYFYDNRISFYPEIMQRLKAYQGNRNLEAHIEAIIIQFIRAKETERITKKIKEEILPEVLKIKSKLEDKLDLENILSSKSIIEKNPDWEIYFKDSPDIYQKFEEFSAMQMEGADVFLGAFAMLKRFDFFNELSNWFLPFYKENELISRSLENIKEGFDTKQFIEGLERSSFLCNSDKYSFCLNVKHLPSLQKSMMTELFNMELQAMNEMASQDDMINTTAKNKTVFTQYFQDLYRFFKLHPLKNEFEDIFELKFQLYKSKFFKILIEDQAILRNIGEFFFEKNYYEEALEIFEMCSCSEDNYELFEKTAFCYQQQGEFRKAVDYYHKAELIDKDKIWLLNKLAFCYMKLGIHKKAVEYYRKAEKLEPDNLHIHAYLGHVFIEMEDFKSALKYYFKVEYLAPDNHKIQRPIAWCSFVLGKFDTARKYLEKVITVEENKNDYMNLGHVEWCMGNKKAAIEKYSLCIKKSDLDFKWFTKVFEEDSKYLKKHGINPFDIPLMIDYVKMSVKE
jgi:tetratricopeptide (TPR) repeat protein